jgi:hypothetical protein
VIRCEDVKVVRTPVCCRTESIVRGVTHNACELREGASRFSSSSKRRTFPWGERVNHSLDIIQDDGSAPLHHGAPCGHKSAQ